MVKDEFTNEDIHKLNETFKSTEDRRFRDRCQALLMLARGRSRQQVAEDLGVSARTLQRWLRAWREGGIDALPIEWGPGRTPLIPEEYATDILRWLQDGPRSVGLDRDTWTYADLADFLEERHDVSVSETTMRAFCHKHGARIRRGSPRVRIEAPTFDRPRTRSGSQPNAVTSRMASSG
jgi:transposase